MKRRQIADGMHEEMQSHIEMRAEDLMKRGIPREQAERQARLEFGSPDAHAEEGRSVLGYWPWDELRSDLRFAARGVLRYPGYVATVVAILSLAIGVNSAFFTLFNHHVLRPLPVRGAERHFELTGLGEGGRTTGGWTAQEIATLTRGSERLVEGFYASRTIQMLALEPVQRQSMVTFVSPNYFALLGGRAVAGRTFDAREDDPVAVLSATGRARLFGETAAPVGAKLRIQSTVFTIIGVMPPEFTGTEPVVPDVWVGSDIGLLLRDESRYKIAGLLAEGVTPEQAEPMLSALVSRLPRSPDRRVARVRVELRTGFVAGDLGFQVAASLVFAAFLLVLVIACANLTNLSLARAASRRQEIALRLSLGASRARVVRQLITESTFLAMLGAIAGTLLGTVGIQIAQTRLVLTSGSMGVTMRALEADWRVLLYSALLGFVAGAGFGLLPAIETTSPSLAQAVRRHRPRRMRDLLIAGQVAASLVLLVMAGLLTRHLDSLNVASTGYDLDRVFDLKVDRPQAQLLARLAEQPAVAAVTGVQYVPLYGEPEHVAARAGGQAVQLRVNRVDHRFFQTMALAVDGRVFNAREAERNARVAVISQATARKLWPGEPPFGKTIDMEAAGAYEVIGVAPDIVSGWLFRGKDVTAVYLPAAGAQVQSALIRLNDSGASTLATLRRLCATASDGCEPVPLREVANVWLFPFRAAASVAGALGGLALMLTAVGLYSITRYTVIRQRREIGVHLALGASPGQLVRRVLGDALRAVVLGLAVGLPVCLILSRLMHASVFGIRAFDLTAYVSVPVLMTAMVVLACLFPALRASRVDPVASLREE